VYKVLKQVHSDNGISSKAMKGWGLILAYGTDAEVGMISAGCGSDVVYGCESSLARQNQEICAVRATPAAVQGLT